MSRILQQSELSSDVRDALSGAFIYGISWDGHCLARGQLTNRALWQMRKMSRKHKDKRSKMLQESKSAAAGGFELMMQIAGNPAAIQELSPRALRAWSDYFTYTRHFSLIKSEMFPAGIHLILLGWYLENGSMRIRTTVIQHPKMLTDHELVVVAEEFMKKEQLEHPEYLPRAFPQTSQ